MCIRVYTVDEKLGLAGRLFNMTIGAMLKIAKKLAELTFMKTQRLREANILSTLILSGQ
jgi:hypothetical protein